MNEELKSTISDLLNRFSIGDFIYDIRSRAVESGSGDQTLDSWEHPDVTRYAECIETLRESIAE